jgi:hydroxymethylpyrimidine pyrophosphatase-like HAD family hydrolase
LADRVDIDGTLVGHDFRLSDRTRVAIAEAVRRGVRVSLATGRMASSAAVYANELGLVEPIIAHQGAVVREMPRRRETLPRPMPDGPHPLPWRGRVGRLLHHEAMPAAAVRDAIEWCRAHGLNPHVNVLGASWSGRDDPSFEDSGTSVPTRRSSRTSCRPSAGR